MRSIRQTRRSRHGTTSAGHATGPRQQAAVTAESNQRTQAILAAGPAMSVSRPGDADEIAAERAADAVMGSARMPALGWIGAGGIQRMTAELSPREEDAQVRGGEAPPEERLQRKARGSGGAETAPAGVAARVAARAGQGRPLDRQVRSFMERRFGRDFSATRVHEGAEPARLAEAVSARAFAWRSDLYFAPGEYRPQSAAGRRIIAHELAHVVQQTSPPARRGDAGDRASVSRAAAPTAGHAVAQAGAAAPARIARLSAPRRMVAHDVHPWRDDISGSNLEAATDGGGTVAGWQAYSPWQIQYHYWCHGLSLGSFERFGYSVYSGPPMEQVVRDEWQAVPAHTARPGDIAVWTPTYDHSARFTSVSAPGGRLDEDASRLDTKNGQQPLTNASLAEIRRAYAGISTGSPQVFRRK